jgi:hypothetical protein
MRVIVGKILVGNNVVVELARWHSSIKDDAVVLGVSSDNYFEKDPKGYI